jgi:hypothetical protein
MRIEWKLIFVRLLVNSLLSAAIYGMIILSELFTKVPHGLSVTLTSTPFWISTAGALKFQLRKWVEQGIRRGLRF